MRIPDIIFYDSFIKYNAEKENKIQEYTNQLASGKKILQPSDNVLGAVKSLRLKKINETIDSYNRNMDQVQTILDVSETSLANIINTSQEARVQIVHVLNTGVLDAEDAQVLKDYFSSVRDYIIKQANVSVGDSRIFAGVKSQLDPFDTNGNYQGETLETKVPVSKGVELNTTFDGKTYIGTIKSGLVSNPTEKLGIVKALDDITQIIDSGDLYKLHSYISDMGYSSATSQIDSAASGTQTLTITSGSSSFSVNYDNTTTLQDLVNAINTNPSNQTVEAFVFQDKDGVYRLGLVNKQDPSQSITVQDSGTFINKVGGLHHVLDNFDKGFNQALLGRSKIGLQSKIIEDLKPQNEYMKTQFSELISKFEDADYASVITELEKVKTAYQALLASFNQNKDLSLLNFLK
ncbi:flagellar hook-associated protein FlgL [Hydrogenothermus marinus]|uniref:Flagellar hook-associated protein 3 FlgL n=1 Tax=Hydrogenothermus marinus TaxID=133270 RepID=A0A3M0BJ89_9AQUI|nr:flagellar hook-associated protein FlgL [Hydrogenothermus marinus]RMA97513.1 flagellar hook-associated protein 3 FlgL [Hydrogenothermus marinus]